jgi:hypothetical protein
MRSLRSHQRDTRASQEVREVVFLAAGDDNDPHHDACVASLAASTDERVTAALVVAEAACLIDRQLGPAAEAGFFRSLANGPARVEPLTASDFAPVRQRSPSATRTSHLVALTRASSRLPSDLACAVATLDHRHSSAVRPNHTDAFQLLP